MNHVPRLWESIFYVAFPPQDMPPKGPPKKAEDSLPRGDIETKTKIGTLKTLLETTPIIAIKDPMLLIKHFLESNTELLC